MAIATSVSKVEVPPKNTHFYERNRQKVNKKVKPKSELDPTSSRMTLTPLRRVGDTIEYKLKCKGMSKPFSKVKAIITPEFKEKGQALLDDMLSNVLELNLHNHKAYGKRLNQPRPHPDPPEDSHHTYVSVHSS